MGGKTAKKRLKGLIKGKKVHIETIAEDVFNRNLILIYDSDKLINQILLAEGLVRYDGTKSPARDQMRESYQKAVREKKGIFGPPCRSLTPPNAKCIIKGNIERNTHVKRYLYPGCSEYARTIVEKDLGEQWFCSENEANAKGYAKATNCPE